MASNDNYEYIDENSIHEDLLCPLCTSLLEDPLCGSQCGHTFCRKCITNTFRRISKCPICRQPLTLVDLHPVIIRPFLNQLNQLLVKCKWCSQSNIQRNNFEDHFNTCTKTIVSCPAVDLKCDWKGQRDQIQDHISTCPLVKVQPIISELNALVKQQSEQIHFLFAIFARISENYDDEWQEEYDTSEPISCDVCDEEFTLDEHEHALHFRPETDICSYCVKKHFP
jgi:hypothetical protein